MTLRTLNIRLKSVAPKKWPQAFTVPEALIVVTILAFLAMVLLPLLAPRYPHRIYCESNLKQVALALRIWEGDNGDRYPGLVYTNQSGGPQFANVSAFFQVMSNELNNPKVVVCPLDKKRRAATNFTGNFDDAHVSYFLCLNADETVSNGFLSGDYNLDNGLPLQKHLMNLTTNQTLRWTHEVHQDCGNLALADGSVVQPDTSALPGLLHQTGLATNRLMFPETK